MTQAKKVKILVLDLADVSAPSASTVQQLRNLVCDGWLYGFKDGSKFNDGEHEKMQAYIKRSSPPTEAGCMNKVSATIIEVEKEIAALRDGRGRSRTGMVSLLRDVLDALWKAGIPEAKQAGCRCDESACKYPLCHANRE